MKKMMKKMMAMTIAAVMILLASAACAETEDVFAQIQDLRFDFSSGAGAWNTEMAIEEDGTFSGIYHDSEMGEVGEDYPDGTVYLSVFSGQMSLAEQVDDHCWKIRVDSLEEVDWEETIDEQIHYVPADVYGISEGDEMLLYSPGTPVSVLSEEMQMWAHVLDQENPPEELEYWFLMSEANESGFVGFEDVTIANPWEDLTAAELLAASGMTFGEPEGAEDVIYRYLSSDNLAEMQFTWEGDEFCARIQPVTEPTNISGMYFAWENEEEVQIGDCAGTIGQAKTGSEDWVELCQWFDEEQGLQYSLSVYTTDPDGLDLAAMAEVIAQK